MTPDRDIDRVLDAWLAPGPTEMPDRVYLGVLDRIERVPQRRPRRHIARFQMAPTFRLAMVGVLAMALGIAIAPQLASPTQVVTSPDPSPSPTPSGAVVPDELHGEWVTDFRAIDGLRNEAARAVALTFMPGQVETGAGANLGLKSHATLKPDGLLYVDTVLAGTGCDVGDAGTYRWSIAENLTRVLTIAPVADACALRAEVFNGTFRATACNQDNAFTCQDVDAAGMYKSIAFEPRSGRTDPPRWRPGGLTFTVPDGWVNTYDEQSEFILRTPAGAAYLDESPQAWAAGVSVQARPAAMVATAICEPKVDASVPRTVDGLVAYLTGHPGLSVSDPVAVTIGGHPGTQLDIDIASTWTDTCPDWEGASPIVPLFADGGRVQDDGSFEGWWWGPGGWKGQTSDPFRVILLDIGNGDTVLISMYTTRSDDPAHHDPEGQSSLVAEAMPVVETLRFAD